jgi:hypothetical protein
MLMELNFTSNSYAMFIRASSIFMRPFTGYEELFDSNKNLAVSPESGFQDRLAD